MDDMDWKMLAYVLLAAGGVIVAATFVKDYVDHKNGST